MVGIAKPAWPLKTAPKGWTVGGSFGAPRPSKSHHTRNHEGVDLAAKQGDPVYAMEDGTVVADQGWSGEGTRAVFVEGADSVIVYGAVMPGSYPAKGTKVVKGQQIAKVGIYPGGSQMAHLEIHAKGTRPPRASWPVGAPQPSSLYNVEDYLKRAMGQSQSIPSKPSKSSSSSSGGLVLAGAAIVVGFLILK